MAEPDPLPATSMDCGPAGGADGRAHEHVSIPRAQTELQQHLIEMLEESPTFVTLVTSAEDTIEFASQAVVGMLGYQSQDLVGKNNWSLVHPDDVTRVVNDMSATKERGGNVFSNQYRRKHKGGHYVYVSGYSVSTGGKLYWQEQSIDNEIRRQSLEGKQTYISTTAHDLKTPVTVFQSALELLQQTKLTEEQDQILKGAQAAVDLMQMTVDQAMVVGKLSAGEPIKPSLGPVDVKTLLDRCKTLLEGFNSNPNPDVKLTFIVDDNLAGQIITDRCWLWQMMMNYLTNAYKFTHEGEIKATISRSGAMLRFEVSDTGIGVEHHQRAQLFEPFSTNTRHVGGPSRLGLYSVKMKSDQLGGRCGMTDGPSGTGSVFFFEVPYKLEGRRDHPYQRMRNLTSGEVIRAAQGHGNDADSSTHGAVNAPATSPPAPAGAGAGGTIPEVLGEALVGGPAAVATEQTAVVPPEVESPTALVIDDTGSVRKLLCKTLETKGVKCHVARNGLEGLHMMRGSQYSVVFCDAFMPVMGGMECIQRFRQWEQGHRQERQFIVGISSYLEGFDRDSGSIDAFLSKPIDLKWLRELVRIAMTTHKAPNEAPADIILATTVAA